MSSIGGHLFVYKGIDFDYPFIEAIESLLPFCDEVAITLFSQNDHDLFKERFGQEKRIKSFKLDESRFENCKDQTRLADFTNFTKDMLTTDWQFCLQSDEIVHESAHALIREAVNRQDAEAFIVRRVNLWGDPYHYLNYPKIIASGREGHLPCSNHTGRLAKLKYKSWNDAESLDAPFNHDYAESIRTYHVGFVRDPFKMVQAKMYMQKVVFNLGYYDPRFDDDVKTNGGKFNPYTRFSKEDLLPITEALPKVIQAWAQERAKQ